MTRQERDQLYIKGLDKFTSEGRQMILSNFYKIRKKVIYHAANDDSIENGSIRNYGDYDIKYDKLCRDSKK